jgi:large subunit ribosomal protein L15
VSLARIQAAIDAKKLDAKATIDAEALIKAGVIRRAKDGVRLLSDGELKAKVSFDVAGASKAAVEKIEKAGGSVKLPAKAEATE